MHTLLAEDILFEMHYLEQNSATKIFRPRMDHPAATVGKVRIWRFSRRFPRFCGILLPLPRRAIPMPTCLSCENRVKRLTHRSACRRKILETELHFRSKLLESTRPTVWRFWHFRGKSVRLPRVEGRLQGVGQTFRAEASCVGYQENVHLVFHLR